LEVHVSLPLGKALNPDSLFDAIRRNAQIAYYRTVHRVQLLFPLSTLNSALCCFLHSPHLSLQENLSPRVVLLAESGDVFGIFAEIGPGFFGVGCDLKVKAFKEEVEIVEALFLVFE